jgi:hypothetical protein
MVDRASTSVTSVSVADEHQPMITGGGRDSDARVVRVTHPLTGRACHLSKAWCIGLLLVALGAVVVCVQLVLSRPLDGTLENMESLEHLEDSHSTIIALGAESGLPGQQELEVPSETDLSRSQSFRKSARLDYINGCWRGTANGHVSTADLCQAGVLMHDGLFPDGPGGKPTWDPRVCAGTFAESPCKEEKWPGHINRWSLVQSSLVSAAKPKVFVPDPKSIGNAGTPDNINVGIIINASVTSFMCAYQNDVSSNTWTVVCPKTMTFPASMPSSTVVCGTCRTDCQLTDGDCGCSDQPASCPANVLMYCGSENSYFPYNEVEVQASLVGPEAIMAFYLTATSNATEEGEAFRLQKELDVPVLRYSADSGFSLVQPASQGSTVTAADSPVDSTSPDAAEACPAACGECPPKGSSGACCHGNRVRDFRRR